MVIVLTLVSIGFCILWKMGKFGFLELGNEMMMKSIAICD